jgi:hypothetical protein
VLADPNGSLRAVNLYPLVFLREIHGHFCYLREFLLSVQFWLSGSVFISYLNLSDRSDQYHSSLCRSYAVRGLAQARSDPPA